MSTGGDRLALAMSITNTDELTDIVSGRVYRQVTVRLWGKGVVLRHEIDGSKIAAKRQRMARKCPDSSCSRGIDALIGPSVLLPDELMALSSPMTSHRSRSTGDN